ncbi:kinase-like protein [Zopfia rhizophila CBS 207.26]|uniref:Kinase-like protein n=1 Tax=Zopfia rhizophila CBS 207.26 TaxID=1314779 RepID=A0A6A6E1T4_9PEZI|nr:kinase-like protein [Zopfia rhizophila CBS 207.26]
MPRSTKFTNTEKRKQWPKTGEEIPQPDQDETFAQSTARYMSDSMVKLVFSHASQEFLPKGALKKVTDKAVIERVVSEDQDFCRHIQDLAGFVRKVHDEAAKLFAICLYSIIQRPLEFLRDLLEANLTDARLPLARKDCPNFKRSRELEVQFLSNQKKFIVTYFDLAQHQDLDYNASMPVEYIKEYQLGKGAYGKVYEVRIHPDQHGFPKTKDGDVFAMKVCQQNAFATKNSPAVDALREQREPLFFKETKRLTHPHLVKCLASWTFDAELYMIFELADWNLWEFMQLHSPDEPENGITFQWLLKEVKGMSEALRRVHCLDIPSFKDALAPPDEKQKTAYHHDIKHQNILVFGRTLRLADFGCSRVAEMAFTQSGKQHSHQTDAIMGTPTTAAPEGKGGGRTSRPYDLWSFGTVILELIVWFLEGFNALQAFQDKRSYKSHPGARFEDDGFYVEDKEGKARLRDPVQQKIIDLARLPRCTGHLLALLDLVPRLLKIDARARMDAAELENRLTRLCSCFESELTEQDTSEITLFVASYGSNTQQSALTPAPPDGNMGHNSANPSQPSTRPSLPSIQIWESLNQNHVQGFN